ncbi:WecB/TagA/CpsF family glycosyltransferase [Patescibacteria group bacterium]|nr:WecB/TagA/CpsF family glycosyltransferase [Patescibacteria group bacterium]
MPEKIKVLKIRFDSITLDEASNKALKLASDGKQHFLATPNPEFLLEGLKNNKFQKILNQTDINIPDGIGILWASAFQESARKSQSKSTKIIKFLFFSGCVVFWPKRIRKILPNRVTGVDLTEHICKEAAKTGHKVFLLGGWEEVGQKVKKILEAKYPGLVISGTYSGTPSVEEEKGIRDRISKSKADILFVAYGAPSQEFWIYRNLKHLKNIKLAMGIGGTFNFIAGKRKRAPKIIQQFGLEWLFRLIQEPSRILRIYNATIKFPLTILKEELKR